MLLKTRDYAINVDFIEYFYIFKNVAPVQNNCCIMVRMKSGQEFPITDNISADKAEIDLTALCDNINHAIGTPVCDISNGIPSMRSDGKWLNK